MIYFDYTNRFFCVYFWRYSKFYPWPMKDMLMFTFYISNIEEMYRDIFCKWTELYINNGIWQQWSQCPSQQKGDS